MLDFIRTRANGPVAKFIIALIIIPFAFAGVYSYLGVTDTNKVATVNGDEITLAEFDRAYRIQRQMMGENFDRFFNTDERLQQFRQNVLQQIINQRLSAQAIQEMGLRTSTKRLQEVVFNDPQFQGAEGYDQTMFQIALQQMGFTSKQYELARKGDMAGNQFFNALQNSNFALDYELERHLRLENQTRNFDYLLVDQDYFTKQVDLSGEEGQQEIQAYYEANTARFTTPEKVSIDYIFLDKTALMPETLTEEEITAYYEDNISSFETNERRRVAHILVLSEGDAELSAEERIKAIEQRLLAGESFEELAKTESDDEISAEIGGDLDWIEAGMMAPEFEAAAFEIEEVGGISGVVQTDFGYHIIKLLDRESGEAKPLEELREQIVDLIKNQTADDKFYELKSLLSEKSFEIADTLSEAASATGLEVLTSQPFDQQMGIGLPAELREFPQVIDIAYSEEVLYQGVNSEVIDLDNNKAIVMRLNEHQKASVMPLEEVQGQIVNILTNQKAREATEALGKELLAALESGVPRDNVLTQIPEGMETGWMTQENITRTGTEVNAQLRNRVFEMTKPQSEQPEYQGFLLGNGDYGIVQLKSVNPGELPEEQSAELSQRFVDFHSQIEIYNYLKLLDEQADITRSLSNADNLQY